jgi:hypothetical protein
MCVAWCVYLGKGEGVVERLPAGVGEAEEVDGSVAQHLLLPAALLQRQHLGNQRQGGIARSHAEWAIAL